ncbi:MAG: DUF2178 domain-containing protein [Halanaerobiales bacterium]
MIVGVSVGFSIFIGGFIIPLVVVGIGVPFIMWSKTQVEEVIEDERDKIIGRKALRNAVVVFSLVGTVIGLWLYIDGGEIQMIISHTLLSSISLILILYILFFAYLERKM